MDFARSSREAKLQKSHMRSTWLEAEESCQSIVFASVSRVRPSRETVAKHSAWKFFLGVTFLPFIHTIYTLITHKCMRSYSERKTLDWFSTTYTPIFLRKSYSSLVKNHCSLFSIPLHYHTLRGDLYPNTIHTFSECSECFWSFWEALEEAKDGRCNIELVAGSGELDKTRFREALLE